MFADNEINEQQLKRNAAFTSDSHQRRFETKNTANISQPVTLRQMTWANDTKASKDLWHLNDNTFCTSVNSISSIDPTVIEYIDKFFDIEFNKRINTYLDAVSKVKKALDTHLEENIISFQKVNEVLEENGKSYTSGQSKMQEKLNECIEIAKLNELLVIRDTKIRNLEKTIADMSKEQKEQQTAILEIKNEKNKEKKDIQKMTENAKERKELKEEMTAFNNSVIKCISHLEEKISNNSVSIASIEENAKINQKACQNLILSSEKENESKSILLNQRICLMEEKNTKHLEEVNCKLNKFEVSLENQQKELKSHCNFAAKDIFLNKEEAAEMIRKEKEVLSSNLIADLKVVIDSLFKSHANSCKCENQKFIDEIKSNFIQNQQNCNNIEYDTNLENRLKSFEKTMITDKLLISQEILSLATKLESFGSNSNKDTEISANKSKIQSITKDIDSIKMRLTKLENKTNNNNYMKIETSQSTVDIIGTNVPGPFYLTIGEPDLFPGNFGPSSRGLYLTKAYQDYAFNSTICYELEAIPKEPNVPYSARRKNKNRKPKKI